MAWVAGVACAAVAALPAPAAADVTASGTPEVLGVHAIKARSGPDHGHIVLFVRVRYAQVASVDGHEPTGDDLAGATSQGRVRVRVSAGDVEGTVEADPAPDLPPTDDPTGMARTQEAVLPRDLSQGLQHAVERTAEARSAQAEPLTVQVTPQQTLTVPGQAPLGLLLPAPNQEVRLEPMRQPRMRALGDSYTAAFGYMRGTAEDMPELLLKSCRESETDHCSSPSVVSWTAQFAHAALITDFRNEAVSGSTPAEWLNGKYTDRLDRIIEEKPDIVAMSLGGNPLLGDAATAEGWRCLFKATLRNDTCIRESIRHHEVVDRLARIYTRILRASDDTKLVVLLYPDVEPIFNIGTTDGVHTLLDLLREAIVDAANRSREEVGPAAARRLILMRPERWIPRSPGEWWSITSHACSAMNHWALTPPGAALWWYLYTKDPWVLSTDYCTHPNARGHAELARDLFKALR
jgi:lysophospholipase L1-like esterase